MVLTLGDGVADGSTKERHDTGLRQKGDRQHQCLDSGMSKCEGLQRQQMGQETSSKAQGEGTRV